MTASTRDLLALVTLVVVSTMAISCSEPDVRLATNSAEMATTTSRDGREGVVLPIVGTVSSAGVAVIADGRITLVNSDGTLAAEGPGTVPLPGVVELPAQVRVEANGARFANLQGTMQDWIEPERLLGDIRPPPVDGVEEVIGHWRWAIPAPDSQHALAQWSGECEVPLAMLVDLRNGEVSPAIGERGAQWTATPTSYGVGWLPDGRAVVHVIQSECGISAREGGVYLVSPNDRAAKFVAAVGSGDTSILVWMRK